MKKSIIILGFLATTSLVGCSGDKVTTNPTSVGNGGPAATAAPIVSHIKLDKETIVLHGENLSTANKVYFKNESGQVEYAISEKSGNSLILKAISASKVVMGAAYELVIGSAHADTTFPITFELSDALKEELKGADGADGADGEVGTMGPQGEIGPQGPPGAQGPAGQNADLSELAGACAHGQVVRGFDPAGQPICTNISYSNLQGELPLDQRAILPIYQEVNYRGGKLLDEEYKDIRELVFTTPDVPGRLVLEANVNYYTTGSSCKWTNLVISNVQDPNASQYIFASESSYRSASFPLVEQINGDPAYLTLTTKKMITVSPNQQISYKLYGKTNQGGRCFVSRANFSLTFYPFKN